MAETPQHALSDLVRQARERLSQEVNAQSEELQKLEQTLQDLRRRQQQLGTAIQEQLCAFEKVRLSGAPAGTACEPPLEKVLAGVRNLITATLPEQVLQVVTEEAAQMGVRAAVFDVRGKSVWGSAASGFGSQLPTQALRGLVVPLGPEGPFRQVYETGGHVDANAELLKRNRNLLDKFKPGAGEPILLLPIRSAGSVTAVFYADPGGRGGLPTDALKILTEFAGAQLDRLMALSGGVPAPAREEVQAAEPEPFEVPPEPEPEPPAPVEAREEPAPPEPVVAPAPEVESTPVVESAPAAPAAPPAGGLELSQLNEADQKVHKDAKRFAKLLVSEIELYNKPKVNDGRKNKDLYKRLKSDIDRSRQTFEKRFSKTVAKQFDYFHEELVRTLAANDPSVLGPEYPGPSV